MGKLCMECLETFKNDSVMTVHRTSPQGLFQECPKRMCDGKVYNIDDTILPTIQLLNQKGYTTISSCGGHAESESPELYIEFDQSVKSFTHVPDGFKLKKKIIDGTTQLVITYETEGEDMYDSFPELLGAAEILYEWAEELDIIHDYSLMFFDFESLQDFLSRGKIKKPTEEEAKKATADKIKEAAPTGTIKMNIANKNAEPEAPESPQTEETKSVAEPVADAENIEKPKRKRGRPKKEDK